LRKLFSLLNFIRPNNLIAFTARTAVPNPLKYMKTKSPHQRAFTLIELLVVIAVMGILAGLLLPALAKAKENTKKKTAKSEMTQLVAAINQFASDYNRMPASREAEQSAAQNPDSPDFTYGITGEPAYPTIASYGSPAYQASNAELLAILRGHNLASTPALKTLSQSRNPRDITYFHAKAATAQGPGIGDDGVLRDPWGSPFIVSMDMNDDNKTLDGCYGLLRKAQGQPEVNAPVMVWSLGPDRKASPDADAGPHGGGNKDNVLSWD
jgi:prepilin-type N-terminal cleavage/methylation domain-containing protein